MKTLFDQYKKTGYLHHAYVVEGMHDVIVPFLLNSLEQNLGIVTKANPDVLVEYFETLGIDEARSIKEAQSTASFSGKHKFFILCATTMTHEAQNALLKIFEEPTKGTHFFLIIPQKEALLPTLTSRVFLVEDLHINEDDEARTLAEKFVESSLDARFAMAKKLAEKKGGETLDRGLFRRVFDNIEQILYARTQKDGEVSSQVFREIYLAKMYLADRGSSPKMLLEHIAIVLAR